MGSTDVSGDTENQDSGLTSVNYCEKCGFPPEYCEWSSLCAGSKKGPVEKKDGKIMVLTKRVSGNKRVTLVRNLGLRMSATVMKTVSKKLSKTIACGSSIVKNGSGTDDVLVQTAEDLKVIDILVSSGIPRSLIERVTKNAA